MTSLFNTASQWLSDLREAHAAEYMKIKCPSCPDGADLLVTPASTNANSTSGGLRLQSQYIHFIVKHEELKKHNIVIERGLQIIWGLRVFEIGYDKKALWEWNDLAHIDVILMTTFKEDKDVS